MTDDELVHAVEQAAADGVKPEEAEARVGVKPLVATQPGAPPAMYLRKLATDARAAAPLPRDLLRARSLVVWTRVPATDHRVVGLYWLPKEPPRRFFAMLVP
jgi:hypothetical protein